MYYFEFELNLKTKHKKIKTKRKKIKKDNKPKNIIIHYALWINDLKTLYIMQSEKKVVARSAHRSRL